jgi:DNA-binding CsgD family transcriptional regulator
MIDGMNAVSVGDARALLAIAGAIEWDTRRAGFTPDALTLLLDLLGADWASYCDGPIWTANFGVKTEVETRPFLGHVRDLEAVFLANHHEYRLGRAKEGNDGVLLVGDVSPKRSWHRTTFYNAWCREVRIEPQAKVILWRPGFRVWRALMIDIADDALRPFGERERTLLRLIRGSLMRPIAVVEAVAERRRTLGITPRELEVLDLVRDGMTNKEIATELVVSPATVRSHLEHAFAKLGAHTRTEATARLDEINRPSRTV